MKTSVFLLLLSAFAALGLQQCTDGQATQLPHTPEFAQLNPSQKDAYWYAGKAEISSFDLQQARYGELRNGEAVMIFVTEPFSASKQVKLDDPSSAMKDQLPVLKLNMTRKFNTGIYPYSTETSVFTPYNQSDSRLDAVKLNSSIQEWCGHTFTQFNLRDNAYRWIQYSYFESEGDREGQLSPCIPEDEIWSLIRLAPDKLPLGDLQMLQGLHYLRFSHEEMIARKAEANLTANNDLAVYSLHYPHNQRSLSITFNKAFPHEIISWEETYRDGWGGKAAVLTTRAQRKAVLVDDYWNHHANQDSTFRNLLKMK